MMQQKCDEFRVWVDWAEWLLRMELQISVYCGALLRAEQTVFSKIVEELAERSQTWFSSDGCGHGGIDVYRKL